LDKVPAMLVVGDREASAGTVALRLRGHGDRGAMTLDAFAEQALDWVVRRVSEL